MSIEGQVDFSSSPHKEDSRNRAISEVSHEDEYQNDTMQSKSQQDETKSILQLANIPDLTHSTKKISSTSHLQTNSIGALTQSSTQGSPGKKRPVKSYQQQLLGGDFSLPPIVQVGNTIGIQNNSAVIGSSGFILKQGLTRNSSTNQLGPQQRIFHGGKNKRLRSDVSELIFLKSPYHQKQYLANEVFPPMPSNMPEDSKQHQLFTFQPLINNPKRSQGAKYVSALTTEESRKELQLAEIINEEKHQLKVKIDKVACLHGLVNKNLNRDRRNPKDFMFQRTINFAENAKSELFSSKRYDHSIDASLRALLQEQMQEQSFQERILNSPTKNQTIQSKHKNLEVLSNLTGAKKQQSISNSSSSLSGNKIHFAQARSKLIRIANEILVS